ncbi:hypothetical protein F4782DRAFT_549253 [Xylaria castorea]|nr:hypothetical protein F4782DRAFT_549253 [Xylaria castorea]
MAESEIMDLKNVDVENADVKNATDANTPQAPEKVEEKHSLWKQTKKAIKVPKIPKIPKEAAKKATKEVGKKMAKAVLKWMLSPPIVLNPRQHPEWPGYTGIGTKLDFRLKMQMYDSRSLVENTIASFYPTKGYLNLTPRQLLARRKIIRLFKKLKESKEPFGTSELSLFMRLFDEFFFFGALVNKGRPRVFFRVWRMEDRYAQRLVGPLFEPSLPWGFTRDNYVRGYGPVSEIHIAGSTFFMDPVPLWFLVETLIHEMVHAYIHLFMCRCPTCCCDSLNTCGLSGHGQAFLMLIDCIDQTLRTWGVGLSGLWKRMCSFPCAAAAASPEAGEHGQKGVRRFCFDEIWTLRDRERRLIEVRTSPCPVESSPQLEEKRSPEQTNETKDKKQEKSGQDWTEVNGLRPVEKREPGMQVYMTAAHAGATNVEQAMLDRTGDIVQALVAKMPAKSSKKSSTKLNLPWSRTGDKGKPQQKEG